MKIGRIRPMKERRYEEIPVDRIEVLNPRSRNRAQFKENVRSIGEVGLLKPIVVNERGFSKTGRYELVCGQGRYIAYKELERTHIPAEVINCSRKEALLYSLVENIARVTPNTMWFAYEVKRMYDAGWSSREIAKIVGKCESYINDYVGLVEKGEARLIKGVEQGLFPMTFALHVARSDNSTVQNVLMDAFDSGMISSSNIQPVRRILEARVGLGKDTRDGSHKGNRSVQAYSLKQLKRDVSRITKEKEAFVKEATFKENRLLALLDGVATLWKDEKLAALLEEEGLAKRPELKGQYNA